MIRYLETSFIPLVRYSLTIWRKSTRREPDYLSTAYSNSLTVGSISCSWVLPNRYPVAGFYRMNDLFSSPLQTRFFAHRFYSVLIYTQIDVLLHNISETGPPKFAMKENGKWTPNEMVRYTVILLLFAERLSKFVELLSIYLYESIFYRCNSTHSVKVMIWIDNIQ